MEFLDKIRKGLRFLAECLSPWIVMGRRNDSVQHGETPDYNCLVVIGVEENDDSKALIYVKGFKKRISWLIYSIVTT